MGIGSEEKAEDEALRWTLVSQEHLVQDHWVDFRRERYRMPDGTEFEPYYSYSRRCYVVIVASDPEGRFLCVRQYRHGIGEVTTEFPAGGVENVPKDARITAKDGQASMEDAWKAAKRELREETGCVSEEWEHLLSIPSNASLANNYAYIFRAKNCRRVADLDLDDTEFLHVHALTEKEIETLIREGKFQQAIHVMAWYMVKCREK